MGNIERKLDEMQEHGVSEKGQLQFLAESIDTLGSLTRGTLTSQQEFNLIVSSSLNDILKTLASLTSHE